MRILSQVKKFETFTKNPENNKLFLKDGTETNVPNATTIMEAVEMYLNTEETVH